MGTPFIGEIKMVGFTYAPKYWADCKGQNMSINQNQSLYSLLGTQFGGDGRTYFLLPDIRGRALVHPGGSLPQGYWGGMEDVYLSQNELPGHTHSFFANKTEATKENNGKFLVGGGGNRFLAKPEGGQGNPIYGSADNLVDLSPEGIGYTGGGRGHTNVQPSTVVRYVIALKGEYPSRS